MVAYLLIVGAVSNGLAKTCAPQIKNGPLRDSKGTSADGREPIPEIGTGPIRPLAISNGGQLSQGDRMHSQAATPKTSDRHYYDAVGYPSLIATPRRP